MESACLGSRDPAELYFPICEMDEAIPISWAFSKDHPDPVGWPFHTVGPQLIIHFLHWPLKGARNIPQRPAQAPHPPCLPGPGLREASREAADPCYLAQADQVPPRS